MSRKRQPGEQYTRKVRGIEYLVEHIAPRQYRTLKRLTPYSCPQKANSLSTIAKNAPVLKSPKNGQGRGKIPKEVKRLPNRVVDETQYQRVWVPEKRYWVMRKIV